MDKRWYQKGSVIAGLVIAAATLLVALLRRDSPLPTISVSPVIHNEIQLTTAFPQPERPVVSTPGSSGPRRSTSTAPAGASLPFGMTVSRDEVDENLRDLPASQRDEAARLYKGVRIKWAGEVRGIYRGQEDHIFVNLTCRNSVVPMSDTVAVVPYAREVILLREGVRVRVVGTISRIEPGRNGPVWLDPAEVSLQTPD
jgi:hypothetical protein